VSDSNDVKPDVRLAQSRLTVSRSVKKSGQAESVTDLPEDIDVHVFQTAPASVHLTVPVKLVKNYNSAGITIGVTLPCYAEEIPDAQEKAMKLVHSALAKYMPDVLKMLNRLGELTNGS